MAPSNSGLWKTKRPRTTRRVGRTSSHTLSSPPRERRRLVPKAENTLWAVLEILPDAQSERDHTYCRNEYASALRKSLMNKKRTALIAIALAAPLLLFVLLFDAYDYPEPLTVEIVDYPHVKSGSTPSITLAVTNHFYFKSQRIAGSDIEQESTPYGVSSRSDMTLVSGSGEHIKVLRPERRGRWRVCLWVCPYWRERLDNTFHAQIALAVLVANLSRNTQRLD